MTKAFIATRCRFMARVAAPILLALSAATAGAQVALADKPLFSTTNVPGNLLFSLSVEFPTASVSAYLTSYAVSTASPYVGYFDPNKCYSYNVVAVTTTTGSGSTAVTTTDYSGSYFVPYSTTTTLTCTSTSSQPLWSGNYLNWAGMLGLDEFRWVLTGGTRIVSYDTTSLTVLQRTYQSGQDNGGDAPNKSLTSSTLITGATPFNWSTVNSRIWGAGSAIVFNSGTIGTGAFSTLTTVPYTGQTGSGASTGTNYLLYMNVQVCNATVGLESNCVAYGSNYKPEGLMQKYASQLRYGAFGYLNDSNLLRDGGVMRAALKYIGPTQPVPGSASLTNSLAEWSGTTGIMVTNPTPADATNTTNAAATAGGNTTITQSGVMNYLNKFGYSSGSYKTYDPVSELYYATIRYLKNLNPLTVSSYSSLTASGTSASAIKTWLDGFPVVTSAPDPLLYSCQKNFILGIGDEHTWQDANLPGSPLTGTSYEPSVPPEVSSDTTVSVKTATNMIGQLEGTGNIGNSYYSGGAGHATYYIAGLAYDAHTVNMRPDLSTTANPVSVTASTYWLDVLEQPGYQNKNQYYYATKYGGFTVPSGFQPYAASNGPTTLPLNSWYNSTNTLGSDKQPDNFFTANNALAMQTSLNNAFLAIISANSAQHSTSFSAPTANVLNTGSLSYAANYDPSNWTGVVTGSTVVYASDGTPTLTQQWDARALLSTQATRQIVTCCTTSTTAGSLGVPFTSAALSAATLISRTSSYSSTFNNVPGALSQSVSNYILYLRGDTSQEIGSSSTSSTASKAYRARAYLLGDIVDSKPVVVGPPNFTYYEMYNTGYTVFKSTYAARAPVVYIGANDGMLHAFDGTTGNSTSGSELFAYIPSFAYGTAGSSGTGTTSGLASLGNPNFVHHYLVDSTPVEYDVDFNNTQGATTSAPDWHTILVGGLGKGGNGYYAIDVTNPTAFTSESAVASKVLWEFTDADMGYTYGAASVVKTAKYGWVVIVPSGYNNSTGVGHFYFINPRTGALIDEVNTSTGSASAPVNLAQLNAFVPNYNDMTSDSVYGGDLAGNVWRVDLTGTAAAYSTSTATQFATLTDLNGNAQPVTTRPLIEIDPATNTRYLLVGTGRLLADSDISSSAQQTFYAIKDGTGASNGFYKSSTLPGSVTFPVTRSKLVVNTNLLAPVASTTSQPMGWYYDLPVSNGIAQRVNIDPTAADGLVAWAGNLPNGSVCQPQGTGTLYAVNFGSGKSAIQDTSGNIVGSFSFTSVNNGSTVITDISIVNVSGSLRLIAGDAAGQVNLVPGGLATSIGIKQLNWRDVPVTN